VDAFKEIMSTSTGTKRRVKFRGEMIERDMICILTGRDDLEAYTAIHIIPHSKGDDVSGVYQLPSVPQVSNQWMALFSIYTICATIVDKDL
jgi:hypothetical protein